MSCLNTSSIQFHDAFSSYFHIGFVSFGLLLYFIYLFLYMKNVRSSSSSSVYINFSQLSLFFLLLSSLIYLFDFSSSIYLICSIQTLSLQILPFCLLLGYNVHFISEWLIKLNKSNENHFLLGLSSFLIFLLTLLIQTAILLVWFSYQSNLEPSSNSCTDQCDRPYLLISLVFQYLLLFLYSFQSSVRYHFVTNFSNLIYLISSLLALAVTIVWIALYFIIPFRTFLPLPISNQSLLAFTTVALFYAFLGPFLVEQLFNFYRQKQMKKNRFHQVPKMTIKCLSLTKEQQRAFMAAYIKRNLTASCENLTRHSTLSVESLCPTLMSTISHELSPAMQSLNSNETSNQGTMTSVSLP